MIQINVAEDFTDKPGARYESQGSNSGEKFRDVILYPAYLKAIEKNEKLIINLDGGYGYGSSFLEEAFGGLIRKLKKENNSNYKKALQYIVIISNDNINWIGKIENYIEKAIKQPC